MLALSALWALLGLAPRCCPFRMAGNPDATRHCGFPRVMRVHLRVQRVNKISGPFWRACIFGMGGGSGVWGVFVRRVCA
ncbi:hypothetical protein B0T18DRAFT_25460 [Schizothecium vesticola]|uniref:Secreted protein n=1 Tax=Schizothecium vesticola TaxID=314040 RepID=A0AA40F9W3_9PEZI|nr:hypothetical protein B0T18DRAFT_25460 [Schizothecium vesticola]